MIRSGIVPGIIGAVVGGFILGAGGVLFGLAAGILAGVVFGLKGRIEDLEKRVREQEALIRRTQEAPGFQAGKDAADGLEPEETRSTPLTPALSPGGEREKYGTRPVGPAGKREQYGARSEPSLAARPAQPRTAIPSPSVSAVRPATAPSPQGPDVGQKIIGFIRDFFTKGNVVVRIGLVVLFFGVAFLIKYAAERNMLPIEFRLCGVAAGGMAMLALGWRLRLRRPGYATLIQGGGVGILYLTVFAAARLYPLLPAALGFFLLVGLVFLSAALALLMDARALALFATAGGFLAPVLMSTGQGDHVFLFSFYALLNGGILGIAWFKAWRELNLAGFLFTFVIGTAWGVTRYRPEFFASTEPFLILFFLMYASISVLYAHRQPINLKGYIDGPLVFGLPLIIFGLQAALAQRYEYGMAFSALALSAFYIALVRVLWRRRIEGMQMLAEVFLSIGVIFASLAIPMALDSSWTTGLWGLEGAGLVWIGLRQKRLAARCFGLLLQIGAGWSFLESAGHLSAGRMPVLNGIFMSCLVIALAGLISNYFYVLFRDRLRGWESPIHWLLLAWGMAWWFLGGLDEIIVQVPGAHELHAIAGFIAASAWVMGLLHLRLDWTDLGKPPMALGTVLILITAGAFVSGFWKHPFSGWGWAAWGLAAAFQYHLLRLFENKWRDGVLRVLHPLTLHLMLFLVTWEAAWLFEKAAGGAVWGAVSWGAVPAVAGLLLVQYGGGMGWPVGRFAPQYRTRGLVPVMGYLLAWTLAACFMAADPAPLPYAPVVNPVEIVQVFALLVIIRWLAGARDDLAPLLSGLPPHAAAYGIAAAAFLWLNGVIARTVHFWGGVSWTWPSLFDSIIFQAAVSITWTITALCIMIGATRRTSRSVWFAGSAVLALVVAKLFLVDLAGIGTVARIISFLVVGLLMLVIGYFSPLPPKQTAEAAA